MSRTPTELERAPPLGATRYRRERDLPGLLRLWPDEVARLDAGDGDWLIRRLESALRVERQRGRAGHWTYDLTRHAGLMRALKHERAQRLATSLAKFGAGGSNQARD